jgi:diguanylate cyclase (GGDEF)-like protein
MSMDLRERGRLDAIQRLRVLDRVADPALQGLMRLAAFISGSESAGLHIIDERWQRRIAGHGVPLVENPRQDSFCRLVVESDEPINLSDAARDGRFDYSPHAHGEDAVRFYAAVPLRAGGGHVIGTVCTFDTRVIDLPPERMALLEDIALQATTCIEMATLIDELGTAATEDSLTGVANRLILADRLSHHLARQARDPGRDLAVAVIDLDHFKQINDTLGHNAGDEVLRLTAARIDESLRSEDTVARLGGDEFVVVAESGAEDLDAEELSLRLSAAISQPIQLKGKTVTPSASVGVALAQPGDDADSLLARADSAMYQRKRARR